MENDSVSEYKLTSENLFNKWIDFFIHDWLTSENKAALKINHKIKMISKSDQISKNSLEVVHISHSDSFHIGRNIRSSLGFQSI